MFEIQCLNAWTNCERVGDIVPTVPCSNGLPCEHFWVFAEQIMQEHYHPHHSAAFFVIQ